MTHFVSPFGGGAKPIYLRTLMRSFLLSLRAQILFFLGQFFHRLWRTVVAGLAGDPAADVNGDGLTDGRDVAAFVDAALTNWGEGTECHPVNAIAPCDPCDGPGVRYVVRDMPLPPEYGPVCGDPAPWSALCIHGDLNCPYGVCTLRIGDCYVQVVADGECSGGERQYEEDVR